MNHPQPGPATLYRLRLLASIIGCVCLVGCGPKPVEPIDREESNRANPPAITFEFAEHVELRPEPGGYRALVRASFDDGQASFEHFLSTDGAGDSASIRLPVRRIVCLSSTHLGYLGELDALDRVVGVTYRREVADRSLLKRIDDGSLPEVGSGPQLDIERLLTLSADVVLAFGVTEADLEPLEPVRRAGVPVLVCAEYTENTPLGRAEWIRWFGLLVGKLPEATERFRAVRDDYSHLAEKSRNANPRPTVLLNAPFQGIWYVPGGDSYMARFIADAGGAYLWEGERTTRVLPLDVEEVFQKARDADYWLNVAFWRSLADGSNNDPRYGEFHAFQSGHVYNIRMSAEQNTGLDFFERGAARPDLVLADLVAILHPELIPNHSLMWYEKLPPR